MNGIVLFPVSTGSCGCGTYIGRLAVSFINLSNCSLVFSDGVLTGGGLTLALRVARLALHAARASWASCAQVSTVDLREYRRLPYRLTCVLRRRAESSLKKDEIPAPISYLTHILFQIVCATDGHVRIGPSNLHLLRLGLDALAKAGRGPVLTDGAKGR